ncbi:unnamed protein product, partial [Mesorhabditis spiculigera]
MSDAEDPHPDSTYKEGQHLLVRSYDGQFAATVTAVENHRDFPMGADFWYNLRFKNLGHHHDWQMRQDELTMVLERPLTSQEFRMFGRVAVPKETVRLRVFIEKPVQFPPKLWNVLQKDQKEMQQGKWMQVGGSPTIMDVMKKYLERPLNEEIKSLDAEQQFYFARWVCEEFNDRLFSTLYTLERWHALEIRRELLEKDEEFYPCRIYGIIHLLRFCYLHFVRSPEVLPAYVSVLIPSLFDFMEIDLHRDEPNVFDAIYQALP